MTSYFMTEHNLMKIWQFLLSDFIRLAKSLIKLAEENGAKQRGYTQDFEGRNQGCLSRHWQACEVLMTY